MDSTRRAASVLSAFALLAHGVSPDRAPQPRIPGASSGVRVGTAARVLVPMSPAACTARTGKWGDVTGDNTVDVIDAQQLARYAVRHSVADSGMVHSQGDVTADAAVDIIDAQQVARWSVRLSAAARINTVLTTDPAVASVDVVNPAALAVGGTANLTATPRDAGYRSVAECASVTWSSNNSSVAAVSASGAVTGVAPGTAIISATAGGKTGITFVTVLTGASLGTVAGVARDSAGTPVAGANVYVVTYPSQTAGSCSAFAGGGRSLVRAVTDMDGRYAASVPNEFFAPRDSVNCVWVYAERIDKAAIVGEPLTAAGRTIVPLPSSPRDTVQADVVLGPAQVRPSRSDDDDARLAATTVPGWARLYLRDCVFVLLLTDPETQVGAARSYVASIYRWPTYQCPKGPMYAARKVAYDFAVMVRWYDRVQPLTFALEGWRMTDIDEVENRVALGYSTPTGIARAQAALATLDVPPEGMRFGISGGITYTTPPSSIVRMRAAPARPPRVP